MDNLYGIGDSKLPKRNSLSPLQNFGRQNPYYHFKSPAMDQYPSPDGHTNSLKTLNSPFFRYLQSARSILATPSSIGDHQHSIGYKYNRSSVARSSEKSPRPEPPHQSRSPLLFKNTAVKAEEDVLVMDGVVLKNSHADRSRSSSSSLTDSGGSSSSSPGGKNYKMDLCVSYLENSGYCRYGTKCQFAHGNKELRASQFPYKSTHETPCKNYNVSATCSDVSKGTSAIQTMSPIKTEELIGNLKATDEWSPSDDDIVIQTETGGTLTKEDIDAHFHKFVAGPKKSKRFPVFTAICPDE